MSTLNKLDDAAYDLLTYLDDVYGVGEVNRTNVMHLVHAINDAYIEWANEVDNRTEEE